ncbi:MAG: hydrogenase maturation nickel metallochaperone HypA [DPANN group archaeon]|nr:hydrogenase maturation nickel metallochaperone HypA [DPANN group archaeon]
MHDVKAVRYVIEELKQIKTYKAKIILGELVTTKESFKSMFDEMVKNTQLEKIKLDIISIKPRIKCTCGYEGGITIPKGAHLHYVRCPDCNKIADIIEGNEIKVII